MSDLEQVRGIVRLSSSYSVSETVERLEAALKARGLRLFGRIDHATAAVDAGLKMPPTQVLLFGNPTSGTPLMLAAPTLAIDLPFKALIWEDEAGHTWLAYNDPEYLQSRHRVPRLLRENFHGLINLLHEIVA
ncbi:MAG TPA: DUF302 domain-containing protein [Bryobacteraceae bacterium]